MAFDPACRHLPAVSAANPGKRADFTRTPLPAGSAAPFEGVFGARVGGGVGGDGDGGADAAQQPPPPPFAGTLFRLPLRTPAQAAESGLSRQAYDAERVAALLAALGAEAPLALLFLKSVRRLDALEWREGAPAPTPLFTCEARPLALPRALSQAGAAAVEEESDEEEPAAEAVAAAAVAAGPAPTRGGGGGGEAWTALLRDRALFLRAAEAPAGDDVASVFGLSLVTTDHTTAAREARRFLVSQARGGGRAAALAEELSARLQARLTPWAAVAAELPPARGGGGHSSSSGSGSDGSTASITAGRAFCFLPLPAATGLPVAVNGYFELSSNRRDVWHGADMTGAGAARAAWNEALLADVAAPAYVALLEAAARALGPGAAYGALWPAGAAVGAGDSAAPEPWGIVARELYRLAARRPLVWTRAAPAPRWVAPADCAFFFAAAGEQQQQQQLTEEESAGLREGLLALGVPLPDLPDAAAARMARLMGVPARQATPALARRAAAAHPERCERLDRATQAAPLLRFALSGLDLATAAGASELIGAPLLPLADGASMAAVGPPLPLDDVSGSGSGGGSGAIYVVSDELELLLVGSQGRLLLDTARIGPQATAQLALAAAAGICSLRPLTVAALCRDFLPALMPLAWRQRGTGRVAGSDSGGSKGADDDAAPLVTW